jgi:hypothetical protein
MTEEYEIEPKKLEAFLAPLKEVGGWGVPLGNSTFKVFKKRKVYKFTSGDRNHPFNKAIFKAFEGLGWKEEKE